MKDGTFVTEGDTKRVCFKEHNRWYNPGASLLYKSSSLTTASGATKNVRIGAVTLVPML
jgi:hypothetical protein